MEIPEGPFSPLAEESLSPSLAPLDLTACDNEQVQFPGAIMPHGALFVLAADDQRIIGASANTEHGFGHPAESLLNRRLDGILDDSACATIASGLAGLEIARAPRHLGRFRALLSGLPFEVFAHRSDAGYLLEFETIPPDITETPSTGRFAEITDALTDLQSTDSWLEGMAIAVRTVHRLTGFDSVLGARFLDDGSIHAVAEARNAAFPPFLDKRFPRSDIPEPGRRQMRLTPMQYAPDMAYQPVPLMMDEQHAPPGPLDLGQALLRSTSPMCNRFYLNVGIRARLVFSLIKQGELWGYINCWNASPKTLAHADRLAARCFVEAASLILIEKEQAEQDRRALATQRRIGDISAKLSAAAELPAALRQLPQQLTAILDLAGAALCFDHQITAAGAVPARPFIEALIPWLDQQSAFFATDRLPELFAPTLAEGEKATGLLAIRLLEPGRYLLGFRPEWVHEVRWAGDPRKPVEIHADSGQYRLTARGSFDEWKQTVHGRARPWQAHETVALADLHQTLLLFLHADRTRHFQARLEESNAELESFAYVVSHDLQEPLRGIRSFSQFLQEAAGERLESREQAWLATITKLTGRMSRQIDALLQYSRANQDRLDWRMTDFNALLGVVLEDLSARIRESGGQIAIPRPLPSLPCDSIRTRAIFENLIANAIKYNDKSEKRVEIGYAENGAVTLYVRDNGIGIREDQQQDIFTIFRRLHGREDFGGGTGAGLTIARKHVERHGGQLWLESTPGEGTTFYFTLGAPIGHLTHKE